jgi:hypothetical protein
MSRQLAQATGDYQALVEQRRAVAARLAAEPTDARMRALLDELGVQVDEARAEMERAWAVAQAASAGPAAER